MASIEFNLPPEILTQQNARQGYTRPGIYRVPVAYGSSLSRVWSDHQLRQYEIDPVMLKASENGLRNLKAMLQNTEQATVPFWLKEQTIDEHFNVPCGQLGDGSRTCYPLPIYGSSSDVVMMVDGVPTSVTIHEAANLLSSDEYCVAEDVSDFAVNNGTLAVSPFSNFCATSLKVSQSTGSHSARPEDLIPCSPGDVVHGMASIFETKSSGRDLGIGFTFYDGPSSPLADNLGTTADRAQNEWTIIEHSATAPASTVGVKISVYSLDNTTGDYYVSAFAVAPESYDRIHLPSMSPGVAKLGSAPALNSRVTMTATGYGMARCQLRSDDTEWKRVSPGHANPEKLRATEMVEV